MKEKAMQENPRSHNLNPPASAVGRITILEHLQTYIDPNPYHIIATPWVKNGRIHAANTHIAISLPYDWDNPWTVEGIDYENLRKDIGEFRPFDVDIPALLATITPNKKPVYDYFDCQCCDGIGTISCRRGCCTHDCTLCDGYGQIKNKVCGEEIAFTPVPFLNGFADYSTLKTINGSIQHFGGVWHYAQKGNMDVIILHNDADVEIFMMTCIAFSWDVK